MDIESIIGRIIKTDTSHVQKSRVKKRLENYKELIFDKNENSIESLLIKELIYKNKLITRCFFEDYHNMSNIYTDKYKKYLLISYEKYDRLDDVPEWMYDIIHPGHIWIKYTDDDKDEWNVGKSEYLEWKKDLYDGNDSKYDDED
jgi:hypothetical protein